MFYTEFVFAMRNVIVEHPTVCAAIKYARHTLSFHTKSVPAVRIFGDRRDNYPLIVTVTRKTA